MVLKHIVSVDGAVSDHALAIQLVVSSQVISQIYRSQKRFHPFRSCTQKDSLIIT